MFAIEKITQRYDPVQDRIGFMVENAGNEVLLLWLTQRLANRLAATLTKWLDEDEKAAASDSGHATVSLQAWKQDAARQKMTPQKPVNPAVNPAADLGEVLLKEVGLGRRPSGYSLTFKWGTEETARLMLSPTGLRQWLIILHRQYDKAGWSKHAWPKWFVTDEKKGMPTASDHVLH